MGKSSDLDIHYHHLAFTIWVLATLLIAGTSNAEITKCAIMVVVIKLHKNLYVLKDFYYFLISK